MNYIYLSVYFEYIAHPVQDHCNKGSIAIKRVSWMIDLSVDISYTSALLSSIPIAITLGPFTPIKWKEKSIYIPNKIFYYYKKRWHRDTQWANAVGKMAPIEFLDPELPQSLK